MSEESALWAAFVDSQAPRLRKLGEELGERGELGLSAVTTVFHRLLGVTNADAVLSALHAEDGDLSAPVTAAALQAALRKADMLDALLSSRGSEEGGVDTVALVEEAAVAKTEEATALAIEVLQADLPGLEEEKSSASGGAAGGSDMRSSEQELLADRKEMCVKQAHNCFKSWHSRYLLLDVRLSRLVFYTKPDRKKQTREIFLKNISAVAPCRLPKAKPHSVQVEVTTGVTGGYVFQCSDSDNMNSWIRSIATACLAQAVRGGMAVERIRRFIDAGGNLDIALDAPGQPPLLVAALQAGRENVVEQLLNKGANPACLLRWSALRGDDRVMSPAELLQLWLRTNTALDTVADDSNSWTLLHYLCLEGDDEGVRTLLGKLALAAVHAVNAQGDTALTLALKTHTASTAAICKLLVERSDVNFVDADGRTPLQLALASGMDSLVETIVGLGGDVNRISPAGDGALHLAIKLGKQALVRFMVAQRGCDLDITDAAGDTVLTLAMKRRMPQLALFLLQNGADGTAVSDDWQLPACEGDQPLHVAIKLGMLPLASALLDAGAGLHAADSRGDYPLQLAMQAGMLPLARRLAAACPDSEVLNCHSHAGGRTALLLALSAGQLELACYLLDLGADVNACDKAGRSPLLLQCEATCKALQQAADAAAVAGGDGDDAGDGSSEDAVTAAGMRKEVSEQMLTMVLLLLRAGGDPAIASKQRAGKQLPLHAAACAGAAGMPLCGILLERAPELASVQNGQGETAVMLAVKTGNRPLLAALLAVDALLDVPNRVSDFPLHVAVDRGDKDTVQTLLTAGAYPSPWNGSGFAPLHVAVLNGRLDMLPLFVEAKADLDVWSESGRTPLMLAVRHGHAELVDAMAAAGVDVRLREMNSRSTLLHVATDVVSDGKAPEGYEATVRAVLALEEDVKIPHGNSNLEGLTLDDCRRQLQAYLAQQEQQDDADEDSDDDDDQAEPGEAVGDAAGEEEDDDEQSDDDSDDEDQ